MMIRTRVVRVYDTEMMLYTEEREKEREDEKEVRSKIRRRRRRDRRKRDLSTIDSFI